MLATPTEIDPTWLRIALLEHGTKEVPGMRHNPRILTYLKTTRIGIPHHQDETPWCSAFVCWSLEQAGIASTRSAAARSYLTWGRELSTPRPGCIAVLTRPSEASPNAAHVGLWLGTCCDWLILLGGNQQNGVTIQPYAASRLLGYRWPAGSA